LSNVELQEFSGQILRVSKVQDLYTAPSESIRTQIFPVDGTLNSKKSFVLDFEIIPGFCLSHTDQN
jgi:hypothetical protein